MVALVVIAVVALAAGLCGYVLFRHRDREPFNPTIARDAKPKEPPRTGDWPGLPYH